MSDISQIQGPSGPLTGIDGVGPPKSAAPASQAFQSLDKDAFLKLLVAQLRFQDPMDPVKGQEFLAQAAQFATVERLEQLGKAQSEMVGYQKALISSSFVGAHIKGVDALNQPVEGVVQAVKFVGGGALLDLGNGLQIPLEQVGEVRPDPPSSS
jgi:flagellar basal-body rod modification protein FlgD